MKSVPNLWDMVMGGMLREENYTSMLSIYFNFFPTRIHFALPLETFRSLTKLL